MAAEGGGRLAAPDCREGDNFATPKVANLALVEPAPDPSILGEPALDPSARLAELAAAITGAHRSVLGAGRQMIEHAIACGEALHEARALVPRGEWLAWMADNVAVSVWTAHRYMRLATYRDAVLASDVDAIEDAMRLLADKPRFGHGPRSLSRQDKAAIVELYEQEGMAAVMAAFQVAKSTVWRLVSDRSPDKLDREADTRRPREVDDDMIERLALWLVARFGDSTEYPGYPARVTNEVRADALAALTRVFASSSAGDSQ